MTTKEFKKKLPVRSEFIEQKAFCQYLKLKKLIFVSDLFDRLNARNGTIFKDFRTEGMMDVLILEPIGKFHGCFIEMKRTNFKMLKKNFDFFSEHVEKQARVMDKLRKKGYYCSFAAGSEAAIEILENYLNNVPRETI